MIELLSCCYDQLQDQKQLIEESPEGHEPMMAGGHGSRQALELALETTGRLREAESVLVTIALL